MADASLDWKIGCLKTIQGMPSPECSFGEGCNSDQELIWIQDLERDEYVTAHICIGPKGIPNWIYDVHILDKGRQLIEDYESQRTVSGIWKRYHISILVWAITVLTTVLVGFLLSGWHLK